MAIPLFYCYKGEINRKYYLSIKNDYPMNSKKIFFSLLTVLTLILGTSNTLRSSEDVFTNIILINGKAVLADFDYKGEIIKKYSEIPYYFSTYRSHESIVKSTTLKYKGLSVRAHKLFDANHFLAANMECSQDSIEEPDCRTGSIVLIQLDKRTMLNSVCYHAIRQRSFFT